MSEITTAPMFLVFIHECEPGEAPVIKVHTTLSVGSCTKNGTLMYTQSMANMFLLRWFGVSFGYKAWKKEDPLKSSFETPL
eukprot:m.148224 g.148224  ORF g.148224 m.148224 type:complete len:81 (-) comp16128_c4_seq1:33-275(-)